MNIRMLRRFVAIAVVTVATGCGGGGSDATPTAPTPPTPANSNPAITSLSVNPTFGIANITTFSYSASASDSNNDALTYSWNLAGNTATGQSGQVSFSNGFSGELRVTVTDGRGGSATDARQITVGSMTGTWRGTAARLGTFTFNLTQVGAFVTGSYTDAFGAAQIPGDLPGTINGSGQVELRIKGGNFADVIFRGTMDQTGRRISGGLFNSGFSGDPFVMDKQ